MGVAVPMSAARPPSRFTQVDNAIQYGEDTDVKVREFGDFDDGDD